MNIEKKGILNKREFLGWFGWQMSGQPMIFPFVQYSLIRDLVRNPLHTCIIQVSKSIIHELFIDSISCITSFIETLSLQ